MKPLHVDLVVVPLPPLQVAAFITAIVTVTLCWQNYSWIGIKKPCMHHLYHLEQVGF